MLKKNIAANAPRRGLYKERIILKSFRIFYRSHYSLLINAMKSSGGNVHFLFHPIYPS